MILHTLNCLPDSAAFEDCMGLLAEGDALLLLGDGVYAALAGSPAAARLAACPAVVNALDVDARARGLADKLAEQVGLIDIEGFVSLTEAFPRQQAWY